MAQRELEFNWNNGYADAAIPSEMKRDVVLLAAAHEVIEVAP
jgi:hypothetical protein